MIVLRFLAVVAFLPLAVAGAEDKKPANKLSNDALAVLEKAAELDVYSLAGVAEKDDKEAWRGAKVLGKTTLKKDEERAALLGVVKKAVAEGGVPARCFIPRHGIHAKHEDKTIDLVICFQCNRIYVYTDAGKEYESLTISGTALKPLTDILTAAKLPVAKPPQQER